MAFASCLSRLPRFCTKSEEKPAISRHSSPTRLAEYRAIFNGGRADSDYGERSLKELFHIVGEQEDRCIISAVIEQKGDFGKEDPTSYETRTEPFTCGCDRSPAAGRRGSGGQSRLAFRA